MVTLRYTERLVLRTDGRSTVHYNLSTEVKAPGFQALTGLVDSERINVLAHRDYSGAVSGATDTAMVENTSPALYVDVGTLYLRNTGTAITTVELLRDFSGAMRTVYRGVIPAGSTLSVSRRGVVGLVDGNGQRLYASPGEMTRYRSQSMTATLTIDNSVGASRNIVYAGSFLPGMTEAVARLRITAWSAPTISTALLVLAKPAQPLRDSLFSVGGRAIFRVFAATDVSASLVGTGRYTLTVPLADAFVPGEGVWIGLWLRTSAGTFTVRVSGVDVLDWEDPSFRTSVYSGNAANQTVSSLNGSYWAPSAPSLPMLDYALFSGHLR